MTDHVYLLNKIKSRIVFMYRTFQNSFELYLIIIEHWHSVCHWRFKLHQNIDAAQLIIKYTKMTAHIDSIFFSTLSLDLVRFP